MKNNKNLQLIFSVITGDIYSVEDDELNNLDEFQLPLKSRPSSSCNKCHGRGWYGKRVEDNALVVCTKCLRKCIDYDLLKQITDKTKESNVV